MYESFLYISAIFKVIEHHDLLDFFHIYVCNSYLKMISIQFGIKKKSFTVFEILLFKVLHLPLVALLLKCKIKAVAISPSMAICPWNLFCRDHSHVFI